MTATLTLKRDHAQRLRALTIDVDRLETSLEKAQGKRDTLIRAAAGNGASYREIAEATNLSFQRVAQIVNVAKDHGPR